MQWPSATRHAFSDDHSATYEAMLVLVLAEARLCRTRVKRDKRHGYSDPRLPKMCRFPRRDGGNYRLRSSGECATVVAALFSHDFSTR